MMDAIVPLGILIAALVIFRRELAQDIRAHIGEPRTILGVLLGIVAVVVGIFWLGSVL